MGHGQPLRNKSTKVGASITPDFWDMGQNDKNPYKIKIFYVPKVLGQRGGTN